jgi:parallel beta-helix repeat protein
MIVSLNEYGGAAAIIDISSSNPTIRNCIIRYGSYEGIYIIDSTSEVSCCDITNNDIGIHVNGNIINNHPTLINNNIFDNITYGMKNSTPGYIVNAENNWWGHATGPGGVGPGSGDAVSAGVDYDPWLTEISSCTFFVDIPPGYWAEEAIYKIYNAGITKGCSQTPLKYCPEDTVTRDQMAVFLGRGIHGSGFTPPPATGIFNDVPKTRCMDRAVLP